MMSIGHDRIGKMVEIMKIQKCITNEIKPKTEKKTKCSKQIIREYICRYVNESVCCNYNFHPILYLTSSSFPIKFYR